MTDKTSDHVLQSLTTCGMPQIQAMAKELLDRRKKEKEKPKPAPIPDEQVEKLVMYALEEGLDNTARCLQELLEYRKRTRRPTYQKGDVLCIGIPTDEKHDDLEWCKGLAGTLLTPNTSCYIPYDSLKDLHQ
jgi:hypothetical protein